MAYVSVDVESTLMELLYLRELWALPVAPEIPSIASPPTPVERPRQVSILAAEWNRLWAAAVAALAAGDVPASWTMVHGKDGVNMVAMDKWRFRQIERITRAEMARYARPRKRFVHRPETAEQRAGSAAQNLRAVYVLALTGDFLLRISPTAILVSEVTRQDPERYAAALAPAPGFG